jgi:hypothetical protein
MKQLISYGLWGVKPMYCNGALENAKLQRRIYPGWTCRFYVDITTDKGTIQKLTDEGCEIVYINTNAHIGRQKQFWRFLAAEDKDASHIIMRDCDSYLNEREKAAVDEWIESRIGLHLMRDHVQHHTEILGGMWGCVGGLFPNMSEIINKWLEENLSFTEKWTDQLFLRAVIWPLIKDKHMAHVNNVSNNYTNLERKFTVELPDGGFVGMQYDENGKAIKV